MKTQAEPDANDRTYTVLTCEYGAWILGNFAPTDDVSSLLYSWNKRGLRHLSIAVAKRLGALVAVCENSGDAVAWLEELGASEGEAD